MSSVDVQKIKEQVVKYSEQLEQVRVEVRKVLVGRQCFRSIEVQLRYSDLGKTEISREVKGGTSVE